MASLKMGPTLLLLLLPLSMAQTDFKLEKFEYKGLKNVLHNDTEHHKAVSISGSLSSNRLYIRNSCASHCSLDQDCDAFYLEAKASGNCHLVDYGLPSAVGMKHVAHGWRLDNILYEKFSASPLYGSIPIPEDLIPPCDLDTTELDQVVCTGFPAQMVTYFECSDSSAKYDETVTLVKDDKCPGEDRLLQCEMENREVESNIADKALFNDAFIKTVYRDTGFISTGPVLTYVTMTLKNAPREVTRIIVRTIRSGNEKIKTGDVEIYGVGDTQADADKIPMEFSTLRLCAMHINFNHADAGMTKHLAAEKVTIRPELWHGFDKSGFKADVFIKEQITS